MPNQYLPVAQKRGAASLSPGRPVQNFISQCNIKCSSVPSRSAGAARDSMLYQAYQAHSDIMVPVRAFAGLAAKTGGARDKLVSRREIAERRRPRRAVEPRAG